MVYCGQVNKGLVEMLQRRGVNAVGLSGLDGRIWEGPRKSVIRSVEKGRTRVIRDDYTGRVEKVNTALLRALAAQGCLPVLTPPAASYEGEAVNVDGDRAAAMTAAALEADTLIILSNVPGLLRHFPDESSLIARIDRRRIDRFEEFAEGRMKKKILGAREALEGGVRRVILGDARRAGPIAAALGEKGTVIQ
jgi:acetylglutamate/LysW-gamma-L-alpha-aminoadipate kinase